MGERGCGGSTKEETKREQGRVKVQGVSEGGDGRVGISKVKEKASGS